MGVADAPPPRWNPQESNVLSRLETNERLATKLLSPECGRALKNAFRDPHHVARVPAFSAVERVGSHPAAVPPKEPAMLKTLIVLTTGLAILAFAATAVAHRLIEHLLSG